LKTLRLRAAKASDEPFIFNSWLVSHQDGSPQARFILKKIYFNHHKEIVNKLIQGSNVCIVHPEEDEDQIIGYMVFKHINDISFIHYIYVKQVFRKMGVARLMIEACFGPRSAEVMPIISTHATSFFSHLCKTFNLVFNPYYIERILE
jgi:ribosomal protein S18 acetylase RimI-like enzyme